MEVENLLKHLELLRRIDLEIIQGKSINNLLRDVLREIREEVGAEVIATLWNGNAISDPDIITSKDLHEIKKKGVVVDLLDLEQLNSLELKLLKAGAKYYIAMPLIARDEEIGLLIAAGKELDRDKIDYLKTISNQLSVAINEAKLFEMRVKAYEQIEHNIEQFAILVDHIRNPLAAAKSYAELLIEDENAKKKILEQINRIVELVEQLEKGWVKSETIRKFLKRERALDD